MLERGDSVPRDLDAAMEYYYMAAEKNDATSAYRYSRLAERTSDKAASFWLLYSAALGCVEAYPALADKLARDGDDELANYYYALSAAYDDTDSIVTLAKRYYNGVGTEQNLPYAKWYMDKLTLPPIHAAAIPEAWRHIPPFIAMTWPGSREAISITYPPRSIGREAIQLRILLP